MRRSLIFISSLKMSAIRAAKQPIFIRASEAIDCIASSLFPLYKLSLRTNPPETLRDRK